MPVLSKIYYNVRSCPTAKEIRLLLIPCPRKRRRGKPRLHGRNQSVPERYESLFWNRMEAGRVRTCGEAEESRPRSPAELPLKPDLSSVQDLQMMLFDLKVENAELKDLILRRADMDETERRWRAHGQRLQWEAVSTPTCEPPSPVCPRSLIKNAEEYLLLKAKEQPEVTAKSTDPDPTDGAVEAKEVEEVQPVPERPPGQEAAADDQSPEGTSEKDYPTSPAVDWDAMERLDDEMYAAKLESEWQQQQEQSEKQQRRREEERARQRNRQQQLEEFIMDKETVRRDKGTLREPRRQGCVTDFQLLKGWGFIREPGLYAGVFVSRRDVESHLPQGHPGRDLYNGDIVSYTRHWGLKGWYALNVEIISDPVPGAGNVTIASASPSQAPAAPGRAPSSPPAGPPKPELPPTCSALPASDLGSQSATPPRLLSTPPDIAAPVMTQSASCSDQETPVVSLVNRTRTVATQTLIAGHDLIVMCSKEHRTVPAPGAEEVVASS